MRLVLQPTVRAICTLCSPFLYPSPYFYPSHPLALTLVLDLDLTPSLTLTLTSLVPIPIPTPILILIPVQEDNSEAAKYELLHKRDQDMTAFMDKFEEVNQSIRY